MALSSDGGVSWSAGGFAPFAGETDVCELRNGSLLLTGRAETHSFTRSDDGGATWSATWVTPASMGAGTEASLLCPPDSDTIFFATPAFFGSASPPNNHNRINLTIHASTDGGRSWREKALVYNGLGAYSDMVWLPKKGIGVLFERGEDKRMCHGMCYATVSFALVPVEGCALSGTEVAR